MLGEQIDVSGAHTLKVFDQDLEQLRALVCEIGGRAEAAILDAAEAVERSDAARAEHVVLQDREIDALSTEVERQVVCLIALRAPMADDLREVLAALRISSIIARVGDCAKNIARRVPLLSGSASIEQSRIIHKMADAASDMITQALDAFAARDAASAARVIASDDIVDDLYAAVFQGVLKHMTQNPHSISTGTHLLFIAQKLERIGDHATSIAQIVHYSATGNYVPEPAHLLGSADDRAN